MLDELVHDPPVLDEPGDNVTKSTDVLPPLRPVNQTDERGEQCHQAALLYARMKAEVLPLHYIEDGHCSCGNVACRTPGNHPIASLLPYGLRSASNRAEVINQWWAERPLANVGIATGCNSGLIVTIIDGAPGCKTIKQLCGDSSVLPNWVAVGDWTGAGLQLFFQYPAGHCPSHGYGHVSVVSDGGYVAAPPSSHPSGKVYSWSVVMQSGKRSELTIPAFIKAAAEWKPGSRWSMSSFPEVLMMFARDKLRPGEKTAQERSLPAGGERRPLPPPHTPALEARILGALSYLDPDEPTARAKVGSALHWTRWPNAYELWDNWAVGDDEFGDDEQQKAWHGFCEREPGTITLQTIFRDAAALGWVETRDIIDELADEYIPISNIGGKRAVLSYTQVPTDDKPAEAWPMKLTWQSDSEWRGSNGGAMIAVGTNKYGKPQMVNARDQFLNCDRVPWRRGVALIPGGPRILPGDFLNLYQGWGVEPIEGDTEPFERYLLEVWANGDEAALKYLINWQFWAYQHPAAVAGTALVGAGAPGSGRTLLCDVNAAIFGTHSRELTTAQALSRFNPWAIDCCMCLADGALRGGKVDERQVGNWVSARHLSIKGSEIEPVPNHMKFIITGQNNIVTVKPGDTRYATFQLSDRYAYSHPGAERDAYWTKKWAWFNAGGPAHWLHKGLRADLDDWHPRNIIETPVRQVFKRKNMSELERGWEALLQDGILLGVMTKMDGTYWMSRPAMHDWARSWVPDATPQHINSLLRRLGCTDSHRGTVYGCRGPAPVRASSD